MESFILSQNTRETKEGILLFGTSHFEYVWQDVCSFAFGDVLREKLKDLPGGLARKYLPWKEKRLQELIEKPVWTDKEGGISVETETWRPDGICIYPNNNGWTFSIQDAKYYCIRMGKDQNGRGFVEGQPGIGDVAKQYFYLLAYKDFIESQGYEQVKNVFLCPNTEERCQNEKSVKLETLGQMIALGEGRIDVIGLPVKEMFMLYLEGKKIDFPEQYLEG